MSQPEPFTPDLAAAPPPPETEPFKLQMPTFATNTRARDESPTSGEVPDSLRNPKVAPRNHEPPQRPAPPAAEPECPQNQREKRAIVPRIDVAVLLERCPICQSHRFSVSKTSSCDVPGLEARTRYTTCLSCHAKLRFIAT